MIRKYVQLGIKTNKNKNNNLFIKKLLQINNNKIYLEWVNSFNWKILNPYKPNKYIL
jgi:hypothetical protein